MTQRRKYTLVIQDGEALSISPSYHDSVEELRAFLHQMFTALHWEPLKWRRINHCCSVMRFPGFPDRLVLVFRFQVPLDKPARKKRATKAPVQPQVN